ncbi:c-type cytochrome [Campylobacter jejuni]
MWVHKPKILKKRFAGNNLSCSSCHANGGSVQNQSGFVGIWARFPQYNARGDKVITLADRINGCFERSTNGKRMPSDTPEMKAMLTYMQWLSQGVPVGAKIEGQGLKKIDFILKAADPKKGKAIYMDKCAVCHQENGLGLKNEDSTGRIIFIHHFGVMIVITQELECIVLSKLLLILKKICLKVHLT